jgi:hypothetical protein
MIIFNKNRYIKFLLVATSSLVSLSNIIALGADRLTNAGLNRVSSPRDWIGVNAPQNGDNIIMTDFHNVNLDQERQLNDINLYGFDGNEIQINANCTIHNIVNDTTVPAQNRVAIVNGNVLIAHGLNNAASTDIIFPTDNRSLTITGDNLSAIKNIKRETAAK